MMALSLVLMCAVVVGAAQSASADPATTSQQHIDLTWDADVVELDWRGREHGAAQGSFLGDRVISPGDRVWRQATVRNIGPSDGVATVEILDVTNSVSGTTGTDLDSVLLINWDVTGQADQTLWADIVRAGGRTLGSYPVKQGEALPLTIGFSFPIDATAGREAADTGDVLSFNVRVTMRDETGVTPGQPPTQAPGPNPGAVAQSGGLALLNRVPVVAWWLALVPVVAFAWLAWRRRRGDENEGT
ncbi:MAG: hypothetical protein LBV00_09315 [Propionibacteriaceae bacterium]|jgi:hypothetical protein|nr:hypothetical protein [Propionibacteriaceae bacterium]